MDAGWRTFSRQPRQHLRGDCGGPFKTGLDFGESIFKLSQSGNALQLADWFTPFNEKYLDKHDLDMSEPVLVLPTQSGPYPNLLAAVGKEGTI